MLNRVIGEPVEKVNDGLYSAAQVTIFDVTFRQHDTILLHKVRTG